MSPKILKIHPKIKFSISLHVSPRSIRSEPCCTSFSDSSASYSPLVRPGEICADLTSDALTLYSVFGGVSDSAARFPIAPGVADDKGSSIDCCRGSTPIESPVAVVAAAAVEAAAAA